MLSNNCSKLNCDVANISCFVYVEQIYKFGQIQTSQTGVQPYSDTVILPLTKLEFSASWYKTASLGFGCQCHPKSPKCRSVTRCCIKRSRIFSKSCPKVAKPVWLKKQCFSQLPKKSPIIWATFVIKFAAKKLKKIAQSGRAEMPTTHLCVARMKQIL